MNEENMEMRNLYEEFANEDTEYDDDFYEEELLNGEQSDDEDGLSEEFLEMLRSMTQSEYDDWIENQVPYYFEEAPMPRFLRLELLNRCRNYNMRKREQEEKILRRQ